MIYFLSLTLKACCFYEYCTIQRPRYQGGRKFFLVLSENCGSNEIRIVDNDQLFVEDLFPDLKYVLYLGWMNVISVETYVNTCY